jgi:hypothetical protein
MKHGEMVKKGDVKMPPGMKHRNEMIKPDCCCKEKTLHTISYFDKQGNHRTKKTLRIMKQQGFITVDTKGCPIHF